MAMCVLSAARPRCHAALFGGDRISDFSSTQDELPPRRVCFPPVNTPIASRCYALVPCAGKGERAGTVQPKQYAPVAGLPMVAHTLQALAGVSRLEGTLVVLHPDDHLFESHIPSFKGWVARRGGQTRAHSVLNGLQALLGHGARDSDWVLVHDAARCLIEAAWVDALIDACHADAVGGLLALPVADTLKQAREGRVAASVSRAHKWQAQTPQMFRLGMLSKALSLALASDAANITDESGAIELAGHAPLLVVGYLENFKVTYPSDFELAEKLLRMQP